MHIVRFTLQADDQDPLSLRISDATQREKSRLMELVSSLEEPVIVSIDLGDHPLNSSVLDEILCKAFLWRVRDPDEPAVYPVLDGLHPHTEEELERGARASKKSSVVFVARTPLGTKLVGLATGEVVKSFEVLQELGQLTARELADRTGTPINVAHNRLRLLNELRLAIKDGPEPVKGGGRQFVYRSVTRASDT